jgi:adenylate cyclase
MKPNNKKDGFQARLERIKLDLGTYKVLLHFQNHKDPLVIHFDKPARRFYFSLIALVVTEMKNLDKPEFIYIRKHEKTLKLLDNSLAGPNASKTVKGMWDKIRKAWRHRLPDLETAAFFKILERNLIPPYEKGGKYRYDCSDDECDAWTNLFAYDENNPWRFKFAIDMVSLGLNDISVAFGHLRDNSAWKEFIKQLNIPPKAVNREKKSVPRWWKKLAFSLIAVSIIGAATLTLWKFYVWHIPATKALELPDKPSIAVLPFINLSGDPEQEYFSDGITDEIITALGSVPKLFVIAQHSTFTYKGKPIKVQQVSKELGVRYILEGSVRKDKDKIRITAQLIDALTGHHLWSNQYDRNLEDIFAVQDEITKKIITAMEVKLTEGEQARTAARSTNNLEAYLKCLQANEYVNRINIESNALAKQLAEEAIALDPNYAWAYYILGRAYMVDVWLTSNKSLKDSIAKSRELAKKAIALDDSLAEAYALLGYLFTMTEQHDKAITLVEKAVALNPNSAELHYRLGKGLVFAGRYEEAISEYKKAIRLNPIPPNYYLYSLGISYAWTGQYEKAIKWCEKAVNQQPNDIFALILMASVYNFSGRDEEAQTEAAKVLRINPKFSLEEYAKKIKYKNQDDKDRVIEALRKAGLK